MTKEEYIKKMTIPERILALSLAAPILKKNDHNGDAGFNFVSIDDYYEIIARMCVEFGLSWRVSEDSFELLDSPGGQLVRATYSFHVFTESHEDYDSTKISVVMPFSDAQTTGIAMSYAEKIFMRTTFKVVTGEKDADSLAKPKKKWGAKEPKAEVKPGNTAPQTMTSEEMIAFISSCTDEMALKQWMVKTRAALAAVKAESPKKYEIIESAHRLKLKQLQEGTTDGAEPQV